MIVLEERWTHESVLAREAVAALASAGAGDYMDATVGLGGHAAALLAALPTSSRLLGLDRDPEALEAAAARLAPLAPRVRLIRANFSRAAAEADAAGFLPLAGALFDLGVSSLQLDKAERGFSFQREGPLDMRMGPDASLTAADIINRWPAEQIASLLSEYGEEPEAERVARAIAERRARAPLRPTTELSSLIASILPRGHHHPATRTFQALRLAVNRELEAIPEALRTVASCLRPGARLAVISFHSLEDRIVKNAFAALAAQGGWTYAGGEEGSRGPVVPGAEETARNPRARSAKLRVIEKTRTREVER